METTFATAADLIADLATAIDAGDSCSRDYDLESLVYDYAKIDGGRYSIDAELFWDVLLEYAIGIEVGARIGGAWQPLTVWSESDLAQVERSDDASDEWDGWSDLSSMIDAYIAAGYLIRR